MGMLAEACKLINLPEDEVILQEYVTKLEAFPADVLQRAIQRVAVTHEYKTPPRVGTFVRHISNDLDYQRAKTALANTVRLQELPLAEQRAKPDAGERDQVIAGFKELLAAM